MLGSYAHGLLADQPLFLIQKFFLRHFDPFDDSDDDYPSFGSGAPSGLDTNSAKAVRASGQVVSQIDR